MRRFLQHVLPRGFHKVRYFGLWHPDNATPRPGAADAATPGSTEIDRRERGPSNQSSGLARSQRNRSSGSAALSRGGWSSSAGSHRGRPWHHDQSDARHHVWSCPHVPQRTTRSLATNSTHDPNLLQMTLPIIPNAPLRPRYHAVVPRSLPGRAVMIGPNPNVFGKISIALTAAQCPAFLQRGSAAASRRTNP